MKTIGNLALLIFSLFIVTAQAEVAVTIGIYDDGMRLQQVTAGESVELQVVVSDADKVDSLKIAGIEDLNYQHVAPSYMTSSINGVVSKSATFRYQVRFDDIRKYNIGPAMVVVAGKNYESEQLQIDSVKESKEIGSPEAKLFVDQKTIYVGELFKARLRLYTGGRSVKLENINIDDLEKDFNINDISEPVLGSEVVDDLVKSFYEWEVFLVSKEAGNLVLPAQQVSFMQKSKSRQSDFFGFFHDNFKSKTILSNSVYIDVLPLPKEAQGVDAVGVFSSYLAEIDRVKIDDKHAAVLKLQLEGIGDWSQINPRLGVVSKNIRIHKDKDYFTDNNQKSFEFIVQGLLSGDVTIPSQKFTYFDTKEGKVRTLQTKPISLQVDISKVVAPAIEEGGKDTIEDQVSTDSRSAIKPILEGDNGQLGKEYQLPWFLFWILLLGPWFLLILYLLIKFFLDKRARDIFVIAFRSVARLEKQDNVAPLYSVFTSLLQDKVQGQLSIHSMQKFGEDCFDASTSNNWKEFLQTLAERAFSTKKDDGDSQNLFAQSYIWIKKMRGLK